MLPPCSAGPYLITWARSGCQRPVVNVTVREAGRQLARNGRMFQRVVVTPFLLYGPGISRRGHLKMPDRDRRTVGYSNPVFATSRCVSDHKHGNGQGGCYSEREGEHPFVKSWRRRRDIASMSKVAVVCTPNAAVDTRARLPLHFAGRLQTGGRSPSEGRALPSSIRFGRGNTANRMQHYRGDNHA